MFEPFARRLMIFAGFLLVAPTWAAPIAGTVKQVRGTVLIDRGQGYQPLPNGAALAMGDRVITLERASAVYVSAAGCVFRINQNSILQIGDASHCETAVQAVTGTLFAQAIGIDEGASRTDVGTGGFGAIGADEAGKLTPAEVKTAVEAETPATPAAAETSPTVAEGATPATASQPAVATSDDDDSKAASALARTPAPQPLESVSATFADVPTGVKLAAVIGGGVAVVAALAGGGGGGGHGPSAPPLSPE